MSQNPTSDSIINIINVIKERLIKEFLLNSQYNEELCHNRSIDIANSMDVAFLVVIIIRRY